jgi:hypothetical protein
MDDSTPSANSDRLVRRANQILSAVVACAVLGVGGVMAYQNRDALKVPDRNAAWAGFWTKKLSDNSRIPKFDSPGPRPFKHISAVWQTCCNSLIVLDFRHF